MVLAERRKGGKAERRKGGKAERPGEVPRRARDDRLKKEHSQEWLCHKTTSPITLHYSLIATHQPPITHLYLRCLAHACQDTAHVGEALDYSWHGVVFVDFVFQVYVALVIRRDQGFEDFADWHYALAYCYLAFFAREIGEVFHVEIEEALAGLVDGFWYVGAGAGGVAYVYAAAYARVEISYGFQDVKGRGPELIFGAVIVDGDADVVLADEFFEAGESFGGGAAGDDDGDAGAFGVIEFGADVRVIVFREVDGAYGVELDGGGGIVGEGGGFGGRVGGEMVFYVFGVERGDLELVHVGD